MDCMVKQFAGLAGVSVRTLHYPNFVPALTPLNYTCTCASKLSICLW